MEPSGDSFPSKEEWKSMSLGEKIFTVIGLIFYIGSIVALMAFLVYFISGGWVDALLGAK